jgi:hypothetical protein
MRDNQSFNHSDWLPGDRVAHLSHSSGTFVWHALATF